MVLYPVGQTKTITLYLTRQQAEELADVLLPVTEPLWHAPKGGEKLAFTVLGANGLSTLILWWLAIHQTQSYAPDAQTAALAQLGQLAALAARWLPLGMAWLLVLAGTLFCISLVRSALQAVHYTVWRTDTQLGSRGGLIRRYEMRLRLCQLNYADLRRSPATWALHYCPVFVSAGACRPELPLFVWREGTPLLRELLGEGEYWVRPPYGLMTEAEAAALSVPLVNWSVDTEDWRTKDSGIILDVIYRCTGDGDIVLLHDRYQNTVDAVLMAIEHLQQQGYVFVTVAELLEIKGIAPQAGETYRRAE